MREDRTLSLSGRGFGGDSFKIILKPGWNLVGNPFDQEVGLGRLQVEKTDGTPVDFTSTSNDLTLRTLKTWEGAGYVDAPAMADGAGYWVKNLTNSEITLVVNRDQPLALLFGKLRFYAARFTSMLGSAL